MTILSIVCTKLLCTNAHLGRRVADHHLKVYICGSRNGIAILDSDKTLICLRNALLFIGSPIRQKGRSFFLKTNHLFRYEIMEEIASRINDSQWKIGAFLTNSFANKKKFRSRKKKINFGLNQQPDCVVILNADRKSSVILEADRSQIPIASLVDSTIPWESYKRITFPIPGNDSIEFTYLFCDLIVKTVILERKRIPAIQVETPTRTLRHFTFRTGSTGMKAAYHSTSSTHSQKGKKRRSDYFFLIVFTVAGLPVVATALYSDLSCSWIGADQVMQVILEWISVLLGIVMEAFSRFVETSVRQILDAFRGGERCATMGGMEPVSQSPSRSAEETSQAAHVSMMNTSSNIVMANPPTNGASSSFVESSGEMDALMDVLGMPSPSSGEPSVNQPTILYNYGGAGPSTSNPPMDFSPAGTLWSKAQSNIFANLSIENLNLNQHEQETPDQLMIKAEKLYTLKRKILPLLKSFAGPVNGEILWNNEDACDAIRQRNGNEYNPLTLQNIYSMFRNPNLSRGAKLAYSHFTDSRLDCIPIEWYNQLQGQDLPLDSLDDIHKINFGCPFKNLPPLTNQINLERGGE